MKQALYRNGFTLIEIMVVITIISIMASILYVGFDDARESSRNRALTTEVKEVQLAIELYKAQTGSYPAESSGAPVGLVPAFINELPNSDASANPACSFEYSTDGASYKYTAANCLSGVDATTGFGYDDELARCPESCGGSPAHCNEANADFYESFAVYSFGAECN